MIYREHIVEIFVNGQRLDLESQDNLNLRFNDILCSPEKISTTQAEYSFEFDVPSTPNNDKIFDYANNLSKLNKFHNRYDAEVYGDGTLIFKGSLTLNSVKNKTYSCNLVSVKIYSLEDIFGDMTMNDIKWEIPFEGASQAGVDDTHTINWYNQQANTEVSFPLVSYGVFQKDPYNEDEVASDFTPKFDLDKWNRWYIESFYPSPNVMITLKKAFQTVGYTVGGDAFVNPWLTQIYASGNLADEQAPAYNLGNPKFGSVDLTTTFTTTGVGYEQELKFPYFRCDSSKVLLHWDSPSTEGDEVATDIYYNWKNVFLYDILESGVTMNQDVCYMYQPNEHIIVIPTDGWYKIEMYVNTTLNTTGTITAHQYYRSPITGRLYEQDEAMDVTMKEVTPVEIALLRNYEDNYELIKGKNNKQYWWGSWNTGMHSKWLTCFPHEDLYASPNPTELNDLTSRTTPNADAETTSTESSSHFGGRRAPETRGGTTNHGTPSRQVNQRKYDSDVIGYVYEDGEIMCYDQAVSPAFICGFSSFMSGTTSVMKNGYSWSRAVSEKNEAFYPEIGYDYLKGDIPNNTVTSTTSTNLNFNTYINTPIIPRCNVSDTAMNGQLSCIVKLNKNDVLQLMAVQRGYQNMNGDYVTYSTTNNVRLKITAFSPRSYDMIKATHDNRYEAPVEFPVNLNIANFFNKETLVSEWVQGVIDAFNLTITQSANSVQFNTKKNFTSNYAVELDNRVNSAEAEAERINYPRSMAVKYRINDDEWGFERSAVDNGADMNSDDWKKYADSGYTEIMLNDDSYVTNKSEKSLPFSYTWYDNFQWYEVNQAGEQISYDPVVLRLPVISNFSYMIEGYDYVESMKHDGFGLAQRFWYRPQITPAYVWTATYPRQFINVYTPKSVYNGINLSYKTSERSLLEFFNVQAYLASNYVTVDVYLTAEEYKSIKNGALVHFDSDIYIPVEIQGYDVGGHNPTQLKMMKKVI